MTDSNIDWHATIMEAMDAPGAMGNTYTRFYNYSFLNQIRLMMQGVAEPVATYNRWLELGRQVRAGSKAKIVSAPKKFTKEDKTAPNGKRSVLVGFRDSKTVFTVSDTDGDDLPPVDLPTWSDVAALEALDVTVVAYAKVDGNTQGYSFETAEGGRQLAISPVAAYPTKTLFHELAHLVLGHCKDMADGNPCDRGIAEFEAESVAYLVAKELELIEWNPAESRAYIQSWLGGKRADVDDKHLTRVFSAVNRILMAGRVAVTADLVAA